MDKATVLTKLHANRALFERLIARVDEQHLLEAQDEQTPSAKDTIAHLTAWEQRVILWLKTVAQGEIPQSPAPGATWNDMDRLNALTLAQNRGRALQEVLADSQRSFQELLAQIDVFSDEELTMPRPFSWLGIDEGEDNVPLWRSILGGPCYAHYQDHFYDFLCLLEPAEQFIPDTDTIQSYAGRYVRPGFGDLVFRVEQETLALYPWGQEQGIPALAVDATRFAYEDFGMVTFSVATDGRVPTLEWWTYLFTRTED